MVESANTSAGTLRCDNGRTSGDTRPVHTAVGHKAMTAGGPEGAYLMCRRRPWTVTGWTVRQTYQCASTVPSSTVQ
jgi:hypothetical protein